jgi:hypothetical protein
MNAFNQMIRVAMIDDDQGPSKITVRSIKKRLPKDWDVILHAPFADIGDYQSWLLEHEVCAMIIDEKLSDKTPGATYKGHDLVDHLRSLGCTVPMFMLTAIPDDESVRSNEGKVFQVVGKRDLMDEGKTNAFVNRLQDAARLYYSRLAVVHSELSEIAKKAANGRASGRDIERANELSLSLHGLPLIATDNLHAEWLARGESLVDEIDKIIARASKSS